MTASPPPRPGHSLPSLTTYELRDYCRDLEHAIQRIAPDASVQADLRARLAAVVAEQDERARLAATPDAGEL